MNEGEKLVFFRADEEAIHSFSVAVNNFPCLDETEEPAIETAK